MSLDIRNIHSALADQIRDNVARDVNVYAFDPGETRQYPCIVIRPRAPWVEYHVTMGDNALAGIEVDVVVMIAGSALDAQMTLADWASNDTSSLSSIRAAVEASRTLGGEVADLVCFRCGVPERVAGDDAQGVWELAFEVAIKEHR